MTMSLRLYNVLTVPTISLLSLSFPYRPNQLYVTKGGVSRPTGQSPTGCTDKAVTERLVWKPVSIVVVGRIFLPALAGGWSRHLVPTYYRMLQGLTTRMGLRNA